MHGQMSWADQRYRIKRSLGPAVWLATDRLTGRPCVLKRAADDQPGALEREHAHASNLRHPRIRGLLAAFRDDDGPVLVLEHVAGSAPSGGRAVAIGLLRVLLHLHDRGLVHGDLKPANLLVDERGSLRLIDLALVAQVGHPVAGGTSGFLAPEYLRGEPASVAGDLYAFGQTMRRLGPMDETLRALVDRACAEDPSQRPASSAVALAALGELALPEDRGGTLTWTGPGVLASLDATLRRSEGETHVLVAPRGAGRTRVFEELRRRATSRWEPVVDLSLSSASALSGLSRLLEIDEGSLEERMTRAGARLAAQGLPVLLDDADHAEADAREALAAMVRATAVAGRGAVVVLGADAGLAARLEAQGARVEVLEPLTPTQVASLLEEAGARSHPRLVRALHARSEGRAGVVAEAAMTLAREPAHADAELLADVSERLTPSAAPPPPTGADALAMVEGALSRGEGRRAAQLLRAAFGAEAETEHASLLARALEISGQLDEALRVLERQAPAHSTWRARIAARLGRYEDAIAAAGDEPEGRAVAASAALALGRLDAADAFVKEGLEGEVSGVQRVRFALLESDVALRRGDAARAVEHARRARDATETQSSLAEAESRLASAHALGGDPRTARDHHAAALRAAHEAGDVGALPSYLVNVATAHHALGELGQAIPRYEEAARLSERLGRESMRAVALTNLGGLLVSIGARPEARPVLDAARRACQRSGSRLYAAQVELIEAERLVDDEESALERVRDARERFEACGASRQALEACLLEAELCLDAAFAVEHAEALASAGLGARASLLRARVAASEGRLDDAARFAEHAIEQAHEGELEARAWALSADVAQRLGRPDAEERADQARGAFERVANTLPPGLRERFLAAAPEVRSAPTAPRSRPRGLALGAGGRRLLGLLRRVLLEPDERRVLEAAVDEAVALTLAERAFLLRRQDQGDAILIARNLDRDTIRRGRFSRSVAERVIATGEPVLTEMATADPALSGARSVSDLGLRSILCVPVRAPDEVIGALYLDHRFESARFDAEDLETISALADIIGMALENARLHREASDRADELSRANREIRDENLQAAIRLERLEQRLAATADDDADAAAGIIGRSRAIRRALGVVRRVAPSDLSVLLQGESGTGKELFARFVHAQSHRAEETFLAINCGALPETLLESELFGHVRGAFTGAIADHPGLFRSAEGGTLFLDEIGEMPPRMQTRLLRVLQEREVRSVGAERADAVDVRVVAATNRDLERAVEEGSFRQDLYFRLVGVRVVLPPLRERLDDVPLLAEHALSRIANEPGMRAVTLSRGALTALLTHRWPGNVRELWQALRRAVLVAEGDVIEAADLSLGGSAGTLDRRTALRRFDAELVSRALRAAHGNRTAAAKALGVSRMTLYRWIKRHDL